MEYRYRTLHSYEDFASGRVLYGTGGSPNFPVKIACEVFNRCAEHCGKKEKITVYDPCCGTGYLLTTLALVESAKIKGVIGSDINEDFLQVAQKNFSLLSKSGLHGRRLELEKLHALYAKESHRQALASAETFSQILEKRYEEFETKLFACDILAGDISQIEKHTPDIVITDVPYGDLVHWSAGENSIGLLLNTVSSIKNDELVIALVHDKYQKTAHDEFLRVEKLKCGKRCIDILRKKTASPL